MKTIDENTMKINLNDKIKVKLTDYGKEIYYHRFDDVLAQMRVKTIKPEYPKVDDEGYTTFQLWDFMSIYGNYMGIASPEVIKPLEIICVGD